MAAYRGRESRDWLKTKVSQTAHFTITGYQELGEGRLEGIHVAEEHYGELRPVGQVRFGFAGKGLWATLREYRTEGASRAGMFPIHPGLSAKVKFFGRHKSGSIRDGVILSLAAASTGRIPTPDPRRAIWHCDSPEVIAAFHAAETMLSKSPGVSSVGLREARKR